MQKKVLVIHGSRFGQSTKIARSMAETLEAAGIPTELTELTRKTTIDPERYGALLLVTSVRYGYFDRNAYRLIEKYRAWIDSVPAMAVTICLTARSPEKRSPETNSYARKFIEKSGWKGDIEVVAGALEYPRYKIWDRLAIQLIMKMTDGPTDPTAQIEYTDWDQVRATAERFVAACRA